MTRRARRLMRVASLVLTALGSVLTGLSIGRSLAAQPAPTRVRDSYTETAPCAQCRADLQLGSLQLQGRHGSTLLVIGGQIPASADEFASDVRLIANDVEIVLHPHRSGGLFEAPVATKAGTALPSSAVGATVAQGKLLINLAAGLLVPPVKLQLGLWNGHTYTEQLPNTGELMWDGRSAPRVSDPARITTAPSRLPSTTLSTPATQLTTTTRPVLPPTDLTLTHLTRACTAIPSGSVPPFLKISAVKAGTDNNPRTGVPTRDASASTTASAFGVTEPFAFGLVVLRQGTPVGAGQDAIDRAGNAQLFVVSDGGHIQKGIRTYANGTWGSVIGADADNLTYKIDDKGITMFWSGLRAGDRVGFVTAGSSGCASAALDGSLMPQITAG